jgi:hypothetical protein
LNFDEIEEKDILELHRQHASIQQAFFRQMRNNMKEKEIIVLLDFKENWKLPLCQEMIQTLWFHTRNVSHLGIVTIMRKKGVLEERSFNCFSMCLSHDFRFVIECLGFILTHPLLIASSFFFFTDCYPHLCNAAFLHHVLLSTDPSPSTQFRSLTFFGEHHGKKEGDSEFG